MSREVFVAGGDQDLKYFVVKWKLSKSFKKIWNHLTELHGKESNKAAEEVERGTMGWCLNWKVEGLLGDLHWNLLWPTVLLATFCPK